MLRGCRCRREPPIYSESEEGEEEEREEEGEEKKKEVDDLTTSRAREEKQYRERRLTATGTIGRLWAGTGTPLHADGRNSVATSLPRTRSRPPLLPPLPPSCRRCHVRRYVPPPGTTRRRRRRRRSPQSRCW